MSRTLIPCNLVILIIINYNKLKIFIDVKGIGMWEECLIVDGVKLPTGYYFGITAATGDLSGLFILDFLRFSIFLLSAVCFMWECIVGMIFKPESNYCKKIFL